METEIKDDGRNRILEIRTERKDESFYELRMISQNQPAGLLKMRAEEEGEEQIFDYYISGLESLKDAEEADDTDYLYSVIFSLNRLSEVLYEYMLSPDKLLLNPEMIFLKKETGKILFAYFPDKDTTFQESLQSLMEYYLKLLNPDEEREILLLYGLYRKSREKNVTLKTLAQYWNTFREKEEDHGRSHQTEDGRGYERDIRPEGREVSENRGTENVERVISCRQKDIPKEEADEYEWGRVTSGPERKETDGGFKPRSKKSAEAFRGVLQDMNIQLPPRDEAFSRWKKVYGSEAAEKREPDRTDREMPDVNTERKEAADDRERSKKRVELLLVILALIVIFYILTK